MFENIYKEAGVYKEKNVYEVMEKQLNKQKNEADRIILEYMNKKGLTLEDLQGNVVMQNIPSETGELNASTLTYWYKGELILSASQKIDLKSPFIARSELIIKKGNW